MKKILLLLLGHICLTLGIVGIFLPILPTTPFLLLAAYCYSKSNKKLYSWILSHKYLGPPLKDWQESGVIGIKAKIIATIMILLIIVFRISTLKIALFYRITAITILATVLVFIWSRPSCKK